MCESVCVCACVKACVRVCVCVCGTCIYNVCTCTCVYVLIHHTIHKSPPCYAADILHTSIYNSFFFSNMPPPLPLLPTPSFPFTLLNRVYVHCLHIHHHTIPTIIHTPSTPLYIHACGKPCYIHKLTTIQRG